MSGPEEDAQRLNPYAPSAIPQPVLPLADRGIGVWRDGSEIVMHPRATLPRFCIVTGEGARFGFYLKIPWSRPLDITPRSLGLYIPLSEKVHYLCRRRRWQAAGGALAACVLPAIAFLGLESVETLAMGVSVGAMLAIWVAAFYVWVQYTQFLYFAAIEGDYLRLKGADPRFLRRLPDWLR